MKRSTIFQFWLGISIIIVSIILIASDVDKIDVKKESTYSCTEGGER